MNKNDVHSAIYIYLHTSDKNDEKRVMSSRWYRGLQHTVSIIYGQCTLVAINSKSPRELQGKNSVREHIVPVIGHEKSYT